MILINRSPISDDILQLFEVSILPGRQISSYLLCSHVVLEALFLLWKQIVPARVILVKQKRVIHQIFQPVEIVFILRRQSSSLLLLFVNLFKSALVLRLQLVEARVQAIVRDSRPHDIFQTFQVLLLRRAQWLPTRLLVEEVIQVILLAGDKVVEAHVSLVARPTLQLDSTS